MALSEELSAKILALIEAEGAGEQYAEEHEEAAPPEKDTSSMRAVRAQAKRLERELKAREDELAALREYKETSEATKRTDLLLGSGLSPTQAEVFVRAGYEATPENVADFKARVLGVAEEETPEPTQPKFAP